MALLFETHEGDVVNLDNALAIKVVELAGKWAVRAIGMDFNTAGFSQQMNLFTGSEEECREYLSQFKKRVKLHTMAGVRKARRKKE